MSRAPRALIAVDEGAATTAVTLLGRIGERWRVLGSLSGPARTPPEELAAILARRIDGPAPSMLAELGVDPRALDDLPRLADRSATLRTLAVLGASPRAVANLERIARRTAWRVSVASPDTHDPKEMTELVLDPHVGGVLVGIGDPPGPDERRSLDDLLALVAAGARRRPDLTIVLSGPIRARRAWTEATEDLPGDPARFVDAPAAASRGGRDEVVRSVLEGLLSGPDPRTSATEAVRLLADVLDRRIEYIEVGFDGGVRAMATPGVADQAPGLVAVRSGAGALVPSVPDDDATDAVLGWSIGSLDRHRMGDRLRELRMHPWGDASGDGARLRLAAARAAMARLVRATPDISSTPTPDLTIVAGGAFAVVPGRAVALAVADIVRRPGATAVALDHARLLGAVGRIEDPDERRSFVADLADDLLLPIGTIVIAAGVGGRASRSVVGSVALSDGADEVRDLEAGALEFLDLPPGRTATATLEFRDGARIGRRARKVSVPVTGGLAGVAIDLRDVPLRLPERRDRRRATLAAWNALVWPGDER